MLAYDDLGSGQVIVFLHGLGSRKEAWKPQHVLSEQFRLIIPDLRGHGETKLDTDFTMENYAKDVIELLDYLEIRHAYFCGLSLGGMVAQEIYKQKPHMVLGLILANTTSYVPTYLANKIINKTGKAVKEYSQEQIVEYIARKNIYDNDYLEEAKEAFLIRDCFVESAKAPIGVNYYPILLSIRKPTLLISSLYDQVLPIINQYYMRCYLPFSSRIEYLKSGHLSNVEQKEKFNSIILDFMKKELVIC
jgi:pimeloyl-ACP methyl ester carboxylesterase